MDISIESSIHDIWIAKNGRKVAVVTSVMTDRGASRLYHLMLQTVLERDNAYSDWRDVEDIPQDFTTRSLNATYRRPILDEKKDLLIRLVPRLFGSPTNTAVATVPALPVRALPTPPPPPLPTDTGPTASKSTRFVVANKTQLLLSLYESSPRMELYNKAIVEGAIVRSVRHIIPD